MGRVADPKTGKQIRARSLQFQEAKAQRKLEEEGEFRRYLDDLRGFKEDKVFSDQTDKDKLTQTALPAPPEAPAPQAIDQDSPGSGLGGDILKATLGLDKAVAGAGGGPTAGGATTPTAGGGPSSLPPGEITTTNRGQRFFKGFIPIDTESSRTDVNPQREIAIQKRISGIGEAGFRMANGDMSPEAYTSFLKTQQQNATPAELQRMAVGGKRISALLIAEQEETDRNAGKNMMIPLIQADRSLAGKGAVEATFALSRCRTTEECTLASEKLAGVIDSGDVAKGQEAYALAVSEKARLEHEAAIRAGQKGTAEHAVAMNKIALDGAHLTLGLTGDRTQSQVDGALESYIQKDGSIKTTLKTKPRFEGIQQDQLRLGLDVTTAVEGGFFFGDAHFDKIEPRKVEHALDVIRGSIPGNRDNEVEYLAAVGWKFHEQEGYVTRGAPGSKLAKLGNVFPGPGFSESDLVYEPTPGHPDERILGFMDRSNILKTAWEAEEESVITHFSDLKGSRPRQQFFDEQVGGPPTEPGLRATLGLPGTGGPQLGPGQTEFGAQRQPAADGTAGSRGAATGAHIRGALEAIARPLREVNRLPLKGLQALDKLGDPINEFLLGAGKQIISPEERE